jgi:hypothetical protein
MKRLKRLLRWAELALAAMVAAILIANAWSVWRSSARLQRRLAAIRAAGDPTSLADLERDPIPAGENAATYLRQADTEISAIFREMRGVPGVFVRPEDTSPEAAASTAQAVGRILQTHAEAIRLLQQAAACRDVHEPLDYTLAPIASARQFAAVAERYAVYVRVLLYGRAMPLMVQGKRDEAVRTIVESLHLVRQTDRNPLLIAYLTTLRTRDTVMDCADAALQAGPLSPQVRHSLDAELAVEDRMDGYDWALRSQRASFLDEFETIPHRRDWFVWRAVWNQQESDCLDALAADVSLARDSRPYRDTLRWIQQRPKLAWGTGGGMLPEIRFMQRPVTRLRAKIRALRVLNALQSQLPDDAGAAPRLTELGLPAQAVADPYTGEPLHVKRRAEGWLIYSVGENYRDDGGAASAPRDDIHVGAWPRSAARAEAAPDRSLPPAGRLGAAAQGLAIDR